MGAQFFEQRSYEQATRFTWVKRRFRLTRSSDIKRVRQTGKSYAHPFIVLVALPNEHDESHFAVAAGRSVGNAVQRNRAKRRLREVLRPLAPTIPGGWDIIVLARKPISAATFEDVRVALMHLLHRANLLNAPHAH